MINVMPCVMELCLVFQKRDLDLTVVDPALTNSHTMTPFDAPGKQAF